MITFSDAREQVVGCALPQLEHEPVPLVHALGRVLAKPLVAPEANPRFRNSGMDGFAVVAEDFEGCADEAKTFSIEGTVYAGQEASRVECSPGSVYRIMTGAQVPEPFNAVVPVEEAMDETDVEVTFKTSVSVGQFLREAGADYEQGDTLLKAGSVLSSQHLMAFAANGIPMVDVFKKPRAALISTGEEICEVGEELTPGAIYNSSTPYLLSALQELQVNTSYLGCAGDDEKLFSEHVAGALKEGTQIILSTGGVSKGDKDFIATEVQKLGFTPLFHRVATRPGRPLFVATHESGAIFLGLPGNPISSVVGLRFYIAPLIRKMYELPPEPSEVRKLGASFKKPEQLTFFCLGMKGEGAMFMPIENQQSFRLSPIINADGWAILEAGKGHFEKDEEVVCLPMLATL